MRQTSTFRRLAFAVAGVGVLACGVVAAHAAPVAVAAEPAKEAAAARLPTAADVAALHAAIAGADRIVVQGRDGTAAPGRFESSDRRDIASFDAALRISAPEDRMRDFCEGTPEVKLFRGAELVAAITYHHGSVMRAAGWDTDVFLDDPEPLIRWFSDRAIPGPRREAEQAIQVERDAEEWLAAMPASLQPFWDDMRDSEWPDFDLAPLRGPLAKQLPVTADRVRALFRWYGSGAGPWSGYPAYEDAAAHLLLEYPIDDLLAVADAPELDAAELEGAARLLAGWDFSQRRADDLLKLPPPLKARLLAHSLTSGDRDKRGRAETAFAP